MIDAHDPGCNRKGTTLLAAALLLIAACAPADEVTTKRQAFSSPARLDALYFKAGHNSYEDKDPARRPYALEAILNDRMVNQIELDLTDVNDKAKGGAMANGDWWVSHGDDRPPEEGFCGGWGRLGDCLQRIRAWHLAHPAHDVLTIALDKKEIWQPPHEQRPGVILRSPSRLDAVIVENLGRDVLFTPGEMMRAPHETLRDAVECAGWPSAESLRGRILLFLTGENDQLHAYANQMGSGGVVFVMPSATEEGHLNRPPSFSSFTTGLVVAYNFEWRSPSGQGQNSCSSARCSFMPAAYWRNFLTRVWGIDDPGEYGAAVREGMANFVAVDRVLERWNPTGNDSGDRF